MYVFIFILIALVIIFVIFLFELQKILKNYKFVRTTEFSWYSDFIDKLFNENYFSYSKEAAFRIKIWKFPEDNNECCFMIEIPDKHEGSEGVSARSADIGKILEYLCVKYPTKKIEIFCDEIKISN